MRAIANRRCAVCGKNKVQLWTLDNLETAGALYLCREHGAPLQELLELAGSMPPDDQTPLAERTGPIEPPVRGRREPKLEPLLDWTPPS